MLARVKKHIENLSWKRTFWRSQFLDHRGKPTTEAIKALNDLATFCYANKPTVKVSPVSRTIDPYAMAVAEGRREVFLYLVGQLNLDDATFNRLLTQYHQQEDSE